MDDLMAHPDLPWHWPLISSTGTITKELLTRISEWDYDSLSSNPSVTLELIDAFPHYPWIWCRVSQNPNLTLDYVLSHPQIPWDWDLINYSMRLRNGAAEHRKRSPDWNPTKMSFNPSITVRDIIENSDIAWHKGGISANLVLTAQDIRQLHAFLDWNGLSSNPSLRLETVVDMIHAPWDWAQLSSHSFGWQSK